MKALGWVALAAFIATVYAANYAVTHWGIVSVGFGLSAPAGVYFVGLAFTLRDIVHRALGPYAVIGAIIVGAALSYWLGAGATIPGGHVSLALASGLAFLLSETADLSVYEPLRKRGWLPAVLASNVVGLVIDSALFLWLAFGSLAFFWGQCVGKAWMTLLAIIVLAALRQIPRRKVALA
jgi:hypothetical protein